MNLTDCPPELGGPGPGRRIHSAGKSSALSVELCHPGEAEVSGSVESSRDLAQRVHVLFRHRARRGWSRTTPSAEGSASQIGLESCRDE